MEESLREKIGDYLILNCPLSFFSKLMYIIDETYLKHFSISDQTYLPIFGHFSIFFLIYEFYFYKLVPYPQNKRFKICFKGFFGFSPTQKTV